MGRSLPRLAALFAFVAVAPALAGDPPAANADLGRAKQLIAAGGEGSVREGAQLCLKVGTADAMEVLMGVLEGAQPHYRDIVWEVIPKFTDAYARQVVASRLKGGAKDLRVRQWCAQALGEYGVADFVGPLRMSLTSPDDALRDAAAHALGAIKDKSALPALRERLKDDDPFTRADAIEACSRIAPDEAMAGIWEGLHDADAGVRCHLLAAVPSIYPDLAQETASTALTDTDWRPRLQAVENLIAAHTKSAVGALIHATGEGRPTVLRKITEYLQSVTGMKYTLREQWEPWWRENREKFSFPENPTAAPVVDDKGRTFAGFSGLEVTSDHVVFVIDKSADMLKPLKNGKQRDAAATAELEATLTALPQGVTFNIVAYGAKTQSAWKQPVQLDAKSRAAALKFLAGVPCAGSKNIWEVLETVVADGSIDTAYLLSSGEPEVGLYVHWNRVTEHLKLLNRHHKAVIHGVSWASSKWFQDQVENIATSTGGKFIARE